MRTRLAPLFLVLLILSVAAFSPSEGTDIMIWVRPEEIIRGPGSPQIMMLLANTGSTPVSLSSAVSHVDGAEIKVVHLSQVLPVLGDAEVRALQDILEGRRTDFPSALAGKVCIIGVPTGVEHDGKSEKTVALSAEVHFSDGSSRTVESTAILTTTLPAEAGWVAGDGHLHSDFSDGGYSIYQRRNDAVGFGYKWIFVTDHAGALASTYASYVSTCAAADGTSLAIGPDQEVASYDGGHYLAYRCNSALLDNYYAESYLPTYVKISNPPSSFGGVAHPNHGTYPWGNEQFPKSNPVFRFVELFSNQRLPNSTTVTRWQAQLEKDIPAKIAGGDSAPFTVGVAGSDAHFLGTPYWGKNMTYLRTSLTPPTLSPAYQALLAGKAVASGDGSFARFTLGGKQIGQVLSTSASTISVNYYIKGVTSSTMIQWFRLINVKSGAVVPGSGEVLNQNLYQGTKTVTFDSVDSAYYLEVELKDSAGVTQRVITNPIFLKR